MAKQLFTFEDFIGTVAPAQQAFVRAQHQALTQGGCEIEIKEAKSGYLVAYRYNRKTVLNYVFRKKGILIRLYANHLGEYEALLETLPEGMLAAIHAAPICKRLVNPEACNPKCAMGYDFLLRGERLQKCRNNAFLFLLCEENNPSIEALVKRELAACCAD